MLMSSIWLLQVLLLDVCLAPMLVVTTQKPRRKFTDGVSLFEREVATPDQSLLGQPLLVLHLHVSVAQPNKLSTLFRRYPFDLLTRDGREVRCLFTYSSRELPYRGPSSYLT